MSPERSQPETDSTSRLYFPSTLPLEECGEGRVQLSRGPQISPAPRPCRAKYDVDPGGRIEEPNAAGIPDRDVVRGAEHRGDRCLAPDARGGSHRARRVPHHRHVADGAGDCRADPEAGISTATNTRFAILIKEITALGMNDVAAADHDAVRLNIRIEHIRYGNRNQGVGEVR